MSMSREELVKKVIEQLELHGLIQSERQGLQDNQECAQAEK